MPQFTRTGLVMWGIMLVSLTECYAFTSPTVFARPGAAHAEMTGKPLRSLVAGYPEGISYGTLPGVESGLRAVGSTSGRLRQFSLAQPSPSRQDMMGESRLFVDSGDPSAWELLDLGIFHGVTTNPVLLERAGKECTVESLTQMADTAFAMGAQEFMCQTWGKTALQMIDVGEQLASIDPRVVVKVPLTGPGVQAASVLGRKGVRICCTACYAPHQVITAVAAGAEYVAPYLGRMIDSGKDGIEAVTKMQQIVDGMGSHTRVLVASVREVEQMEELAARGCTTFTISPEVGKALVEEEATMTAAEDFERAADAMQGSGKKQIGFSL